MAMGIREARAKLPALVKRAASGREDLALGRYGADEVTLISSRKYAVLKEEVQRLRTAVLRPELAPSTRPEPGGDQHDEPFAGLQRALDQGRLSAGSEHGYRRARRVIPECRMEED
ncbi:MAG TPA: hypothetical protein VF541_20045 [Longimicrobium sp.]